MKFNNLFKKTMESLEEATLSFWMMCLIVFVLSIGQGCVNKVIDMYRPMGTSCLEEHRYLLGMSTDDVMEYEDESEVEYVDDGEHWYMSRWEYITTSWVCLLEMVVAVLLIPIIYYYGMVFAIESLEKQPIVKGKNLPKVLLAQLLFSFIGIIIACGIALIWMGSSNHDFILCLLGILIVLAGVVYLSIRCSAIAYVAIKYQSYNVKEIVRQSAQLIKDNMLKVILYRIWIVIVMIGVAVLYTMINELLMSKLVFELYVSINLICLSMIHVIYMAFISMFNSNMYKELDV